LNIEVPKIEEEAKANLTLFDPNAEWTFTAKSNQSKSKNSPWIEKELKGRAVAVFNNNKHWLDV
ncbi:MAG: dihydroorotase, partial [Cyclobacteriaceae bacterium]